MSEAFPVVNCVMTVPETARRLGVGRKVVYNLLENGSLRFTRVRGAVLIDCDSVDDFQRRGEMT